MRHVSVYNYISHIDVHTFHLASVISISMPCLSVCRNMEDFVTWTDTSKIRKHVLEYNEEVYTVIVASVQGLCYTVLAAVAELVGQ